MPSKQGLPTGREAAVNSAVRAEALNLVTYRSPYDLRQAVDRDALRAALLRIALQQGFPPRSAAKIVAAGMPDDDGVYYLLLIAYQGSGEHVPMLLPEAAVPYVLFGMGALDALSSARELAPDPKLLPLDLK